MRIIIIAVLASFAVSDNLFASNDVFNLLAGAVGPAAKDNIAFLEKTVPLSESYGLKQGSIQDPEIQKLIDTAQKDGELPAIAALIHTNGEDIYFHAQGKRSMQNEAQVEITDKWHLGSDTKAMTAFLVALGIQAGRFSYNTPLTAIFPEIQAHPQNKDLVLGDLLSHASGLKDVKEIQNGSLLMEVAGSTASLSSQRIKMMDAALAEAPHADPQDAGQPLRSFHYANINYIILGAVLEKVYGKPWETLIQEQLFEPLKMDSCGFGAAGSIDETEPSQPWPHVVENGNLIGVPPKYKLDNPPMLGPAGTVHCSLESWRKFINELILTWNGNGGLLTDRAVASVYFSNAKGSSYTYGGLGRLDDEFKSPLFLHSGSNSLNYAIVRFTPQDGAFMLLTTNSGQPKAAQAMERLAQSASKIAFDQ